jgi:hypothetical protein
MNRLQMAEVDLVFPGNKKCKAASGSLLKDGTDCNDFIPVARNIFDRSCRN